MGNVYPFKNDQRRRDAGRREAQEEAARDAIRAVVVELQQLWKARSRGCIEANAANRHPGLWIKT